MCKECRLAELQAAFLYHIQKKSNKKKRTNMRKSIFPFITIVLTVMAFLTTRRASAQRKKVTQKNLEDAKQNLRAAQIAAGV